MEEGRRTQVLSHVDEGGWPGFSLLPIVLGWHLHWPAVCSVGTIRIVCSEEWIFFFILKQVASLNMGKFVKILFTCPLDCSQDFWQLPVTFSNVLNDQQETSSQHFECSSVPNRSNTWVTNLTKILSLSLKSS